ncbi:MAG: threonylcarbamoyl-AMP synthase [Candidatus Omnitrophota bacterium]|jgi:L-threonylcarbamoyladenylate synthase|nr:MAG: threonylcarbamoyl-AMP synthase [Candidatus Omnitrophota bacterium]
MSQYFLLDDQDCAIVIESCCKILRKGGILCVPTDTVYGLVCDPADVKAINRIIQLKSRPEDKPFALFTRTLTLSRPCPAAEILSNHFWPGPLTIIVPADPFFPYSYKGTVGLRSPDYPFIQTLLSAWGGSLANTSLNYSGNAPVWSLQGMERILEKVDGIVDAGILPQQPPSTVVDCTIAPPKIVREGVVKIDSIDGLF